MVCVCVLLMQLESKQISPPPLCYSLYTLLRDMKIWVHCLCQAEPSLYDLMLVGCCDPNSMET